jgi:hypothetical protein
MVTLIFCLLPLPLLDFDNHSELMQHKEIASYRPSSVRTRHWGISLVMDDVHQQQQVQLGPSYQLPLQ